MKKCNEWQPQMIYMWMCGIDMYIRGIRGMKLEGGGKMQTNGGERDKTTERDC